MSERGGRLERERGVLGTLLLDKHVYKELPSDFTEDAFETFDYRGVFAKFRKQFIETGEPSNVILFERENPELRNLLRDILFASVPMNGRFKSEAMALMNHRPIETEQARERASPLLGEFRSNSEKGFQFEILNGKEIISMEIPEQSFLVRNLFSENSVNFLSGEEGSGKSLLAMNLALSIAIGADKWLEFEIVKHGKVIYLNNELAFIDFARRLKTMGNNLPTKGDISNLIAPREVPALKDCWETLNELCEREKPCLIVIDTLYFSHNQDENDSSDMKALMRLFLSLRDKYSLAVLLIHHTKKGASTQKMHNDQMRGSNVFGGVTDTILQFRRSALDETMRIMKPTKFRHVSDENRKCRLLSLDAKSLWFKDEGETDEGEHIAKLAPTAEQEIDFVQILSNAKELSRREIVERCEPLGYDERTIDRMLKKAKSKGTLKEGSKYGTYTL